MLEPREFEDEYPAEKLKDDLPDRPISSLRDIQYLYGRLYTLATAGGGEYAAYLTPDQATDLFDEPESLIIARADLSGEQPRLDPDRPVAVTKYSRDLVSRVAHCKYNAARGFDHSITHRSGRNSGLEKLTRYLNERFTAWATDDVIQTVADDHEEGWIVDALAELGENEAEMDRLESALEAELGGSTTALLTVRVRLEPNGPYLWPGDEDVDVFNAAMRARKLSKLVSKGKATESAGTATDLITGIEARTVGTAEDPLNYYLGKQMEKFPGFDPDEAWRTHPVSEDAAVTIMNAETFIDACTYSTYGASVYYLPYFLGYVEPEDAYLLYDLLYEAVEDGEMTPIETAYERLGPGGVYQELELRFYVAAVMKHQMSRYDVFGDTLDGSLIYPVDLAAAHREVLNSWVFDVEDVRETRISPPMPTYEEWSLLQNVDYVDTVATGAYFYSTFSHGDDDQNASADDERIRALVSVLAGDPLSVESVLSEYVTRLLEDNSDSFPRLLIAAQFAQLCALASEGLLVADDERYEAITEDPAYESSQFMQTTDTPVRADGGSRAAARAAKLEQFIDETPAFENDERQGSFLLGVLVGQIGGYQQGSEGRSTTVVDQYPIKSMTKTRIKRITEEVLDKNVVYSRENRMRSTMYAEVVDRIVETFTHTEREPEDWEITSDDLRFYYGLGVSYGLNNWTEGEEEENTTETED